MYPGFFDPFTLGHLDIVLRSSKIFDQVAVVVAKDSPKSSWFSFEDRIEIVREIFSDQPNVLVDSFEGLLINYAKEKGFNVLLRGIRTVSDFEYEFQMSLANKTMESSIETYFMMTDSKYSFLSSTLIREIARLGGDISQMVPKIVQQKIKAKYT